MSPVLSLLDRVRANEKQKLDELCQWLSTHLHQPIGWSVLAQRSHMSNEELHLLFMSHHNMSPMQWIRVQRENLLNAAYAQPIVHLDARSQHG